VWSRPPRRAHSNRQPLGIQLRHMTLEIGGSSHPHLTLMESGGLIWSFMGGSSLPYQYPFYPLCTAPDYRASSKAKVDFLLTWAISRSKHPNMPPKVDPLDLPPWRQDDRAGSTRTAAQVQPSAAPLTTASTLFFQPPAPSLVPSEMVTTASTQPPSPWYPLPVDPFLGDDTPNASVVASSAPRDRIPAARSEV